MCEGPWIVTYTGKQFFPFSPIDSSIDIRDIAHALSNICRFCGHVSSFYSVAQHSIIVAKHLLTLPHCKDKKLLLVFAGLLHDSAEAYTCDFPGPIRPRFKNLIELQDNLTRVIFAKFGIPFSLFKEQELYNADMKVLMTEKRDLIAPHHQPWGIDYTPLKESIIPMPPKQAEYEFLTVFLDLESQLERIK